MSNKENSSRKSLPDSFEKTLKAIIKFLHFDWDTTRFKCVLNHKNDKFNRKRRCIDNDSLDSSPYGSNVSNEKQKIDIYQKKHITWINSAINKVQLAMKKRNIDLTPLSSYKSSPVKIVFCPKTQFSVQSQSQGTFTINSIVS